MRRVVNFGSVNVDHVYQVEHFVRPGETLASRAYTRGAGGKGFNQSIALARAGIPVTHCGAIGADGVWLKEKLAAEGVDVSALRVMPGVTGHAVIQVAPDGQNAIVLHAGANRELDAAAWRETFARFGPGDVLLCQNETNGIADALGMAKARGMEVWFNPAPITPDVGAYPIEAVDGLILNEIEGAALAGAGEADRMLSELLRRWPHLRVVLTLGAAGARYGDVRNQHFTPAPRVEAIDTTAAGDTFIGYFLASLLAGAPVANSLARACRAASLSVGRPGAAESVPFAHEVESA